jgi:hypothetical protein
MIEDFIWAARTLFTTSPPIKQKTTARSSPVFLLYGPGFSLQSLPQYKHIF